MDTSTGDITGWDWDFGDGTFSTLQDPIHVFTVPGTYIVTLEIFSIGNLCEISQGCIDQKTITVK